MNPSNTWNEEVFLVRILIFEFYGGKDPYPCFQMRETSSLVMCNSLTVTDFVLFLISILSLFSKPVIPFEKYYWTTTVNHKKPTTRLQLNYNFYTTFIHFSNNLHTYTQHFDCNKTTTKLQQKWTPTTTKLRQTTDYNLKETSLMWENFFLGITFVIEILLARICLFFGCTLKKHFFWSTFQKKMKTSGVFFLYFSFLTITAIDR